MDEDSPCRSCCLPSPTNDSAALPGRRLREPAESPCGESEQHWEYPDLGPDEAVSVLPDLAQTYANPNNSRHVPPCAKSPENHLLCPLRNQTDIRAAKRSSRKRHWEPRAGRRWSPTF